MNFSSKLYRAAHACLNDNAYKSICVAVFLLTACRNVPMANPEGASTENFVRSGVGPLFEIQSMQGNVVGWLYGSVHRSVKGIPAISSEAIQRLAFTKDIHIESTNDAGDDIQDQVVTRELINSEFPRPTKAFDVINDIIKYSEDSKKRGALGYDDSIMQIATNNRAYIDLLVSLYGYCEVHHGNGTEGYIRLHVAGAGYTIHALEPQTARDDAVRKYRDTSGNGADRKGDDTGVDFRIKKRPKTESEAKAVLQQMICPAMVTTLKETVLSNQDNYDNTESNMFRELNHIRNEQFAVKITEAVNNNKMPFVAIGRAHLLNKGNVVDMLRSRGFVMKRIH
ncbi:MAG: hypothetical protein JWN23_2800 [Rhodocyclales bacterium]|nr:hypothetical protein [Rhodocyclales bacterium]